MCITLARRGGKNTLLFPFSFCYPLCLPSSWVTSSISQPRDWGGLTPSVVPYTSRYPLSPHIWTCLASGMLLSCIFSWRGAPRLRALCVLAVFLVIFGYAAYFPMNVDIQSWRSLTHSPRNVQEGLWGLFLSISFLVGEAPTLSLGMRPFLHSLAGLVTCLRAVASQWRNPGLVFQLQEGCH